MVDWNFQGSNDGIVWDDLKVHDNDQSSWRNGAILSWPVNEKMLDTGNPASYRHFRVVVVGKSASIPHKLALCGLELYGYLDETTRTNSST